MKDSVRLNFRFKNFCFPHVRKIKLPELRRRVPRTSHGYHSESQTDSPACPEGAEHESMYSNTMTSLPVGIWRLLLLQHAQGSSEPLTDPGTSVATSGVTAAQLTERGRERGKSDFHPPTHYWLLWVSLVEQVRVDMVTVSLTLRAAWAGLDPPLNVFLPLMVADPELCVISSRLRGWLE